MKDFLRPLQKPQLLIIAVVLAMAAGYAWDHPASKALTQTPGMEPFSIVALPDTQIYTELYPERFLAQTEWIAAHKKDKNIVFVSHLGDIVQHVDRETEWKIASDAMGALDNVVPYGIAPGNHDMLPDTTTPLYAQYFPLSRLRQSAAWGGSLPATAGSQSPAAAYAGENSYHLFSAGGTNFIALNLEFCPSADVMDWANSVLYQYHTRTAIIATHSFLNAAGKRTDSRECNANHKAGNYDGEGMWESLFVHNSHDNVLLILSGHDIWTKTGAARRTDYVDGHPVYQLLSDYQHLEYGGDAYLRIMTFHPDTRKIDVRTYSPYQDTYRTDAQNQFELRW